VLPTNPRVQTMKLFAHPTKNMMVQGSSVFSGFRCDVAALREAKGLDSALARCAQDAKTPRKAKPDFNVRGKSLTAQPLKMLLQDFLRVLCGLSECNERARHLKIFSSPAALKTRSRKERHNHPRSAKNSFGSGSKRKNDRGVFSGFRCDVAALREACL